MSEKVNKNRPEVKNIPILYSLRNCPYAMRARIAIFKAEQSVLLRDLVLSNKPEDMLKVSPKGTVPVLVLVNGKVIEESLEVMLWALQESDPKDLLHAQHVSQLNSADGCLNTIKTGDSLSEILNLIDEFDNEFKACLEQYKCAKRYQENNIEECRFACQAYLDKLEYRLSKHKFLMSNKESLADIALMPFIRQFARVERQWYLQSPYPMLRQWLNDYLQSVMFSKVMAKHVLWLENKDDVLFGSH